MSVEDGKTGRMLKQRPGYEVGYAKPPKNTRFQPGQSGNPRGRPKGAKTKRPAMHEERLKEIILDEAYRTISVREGTRNVSISMAQAVIRAMAVKAAKGEYRSQRLFAELLASVENSRKMQHDAYFESVVIYKLEWEKELARQERLGITDGQRPPIHPDQLIIDTEEGTVRRVGPAGKFDLAEYERWKANKPLIRAAIDDLKEELELEDDPEERASMEEYIKKGEDLLEMVCKAVPD